jgi:hypothetical protein
MALLTPAAAAETQIKPFVGAAFAGNTTFVDLEGAAGRRHGTIGVSVTWLRDLFGVDVDVARMPGFFQSGEKEPPLVQSSGVTTLTGNVVLTLPRRLTEYTLRPYLLGGAGLMRVGIDDVFDAVPISETLVAMDVGVGVTGFLTNRFGVSWELRRFSTFSREAPIRGNSLGPEDLSFWRASMAFAFRY